MYTLRDKVNIIFDILTNQKKGNSWISEESAAKLLGCAPITLRRKAKSNEWDIDFRSNNGRNFEYCLKSINRYKDKTSSK